MQRIINPETAVGTIMRGIREAISTGASSHDFVRRTLAETITELGGDVNRADDRGRTLTHAAAEMGVAEVVDALVEAKCRLSVTDLRGATPLLLASAAGRSETVGVLLRADKGKWETKDSADSSGITPLIAAAENGHVDVVTQLIDAGANRELRDRQGRDALLAAVKSGALKVVALLSQRPQPKPKKTDESPKTSAEKGPELLRGPSYDLMRSALRADKSSAQGGTAVPETPLVAAAASGNFEIVETLLAAGYNEDESDALCTTPLIAAARAGHPEVIDLLIRKKALVDKAPGKPAKTALHAASQAGQLACVKKLLDRRADTEKVDAAGRTALHLAAAFNHKEVAGFLIAEGASLEVEDADKNTPLSLAAAEGHVDVVEFLLRAGAQFEKENRSGMTPLLIASSVGHAHVVQLLLLAGASLKKKDKFGATALIWASGAGHGAVVDILIEVAKKTDDKYVNEQDDFGTSALIAGAAGHPRIVETLLHGGARHSDVDALGRTALHVAANGGFNDVAAILVRAGADIELTDRAGVTALYLASEANHRDIVALLLGFGADRNRAATKNKWTPLYVASFRGNEEIVQMLLLAGHSPKEADLEVMAMDDSSTAMTAACLSGRENVVSMLLGCNADVNRPDQYGKAPLFLAALKGHARIVDILIHAGAKLDMENFKKRTPLIAACRNGHKGVVDILLRAGADKEKADKDGVTPLIVACKRGHTELVITLLRAGANHHAFDNTRETALIAACRAKELSSGHTEIVDILLRRGSDPLWTTAKGENSISIAIENGHMDIAEILLRRGADPGILVNSVTDDVTRMLLVMFGSKVLPPGWSPESMFQQLAALMARRDDKFVWEVVSLGCPLSFLKAALSPDGRPPSIKIFGSIDQNTFDVDTRDNTGETVLHWAARWANPAVVKNLVTAKKFDVNARDHLGRTPIFAATSKPIAQQLIDLGADPRVVDCNGEAPLVAGSPGRQNIVRVTVAFAGNDKSHFFPDHTAAEAILLGSTLNPRTPAPENSIYKDDKLRPGRFAWSSKKLATETSARNPGEFPVLWKSTQSGQLCVRLAHLDWVKARHERADVVVFVHPVEDLSSIGRLVQQTVTEIGSLAEFQGTTLAMLGIGKELRDNPELRTELSRKSVHIASLEQARSIARKCHIHGSLECESDSADICEAVFRCIGVRVMSAAFRRSPLSDLVLPPADTYCPDPLNDDEELGEVKVLILGHQGSGKTCLLKRLHSEDKRRTGLFTIRGPSYDTMPNPKSTIGIKFCELRNLVRGRLLRFIDFGGQTQYGVVHDQYMSPFNSIYLIVLNMSVPSSCQAQARHWMHYLQSHARGPRSGSAILLVLTMRDTQDANTVKLCEATVKKEVEQWHVTRMMENIEIISVSNKTGEGLKRVSELLDTISQKVGAIKVPHVFKKAQAEIIANANRAHRVFMNIDEAKELVQDVESRSAITEHDAWEDLFGHLHNVGVAVYEPESQMCCLDVHILARFMSAFVAPSQHIARLFDSDTYRRFSSDTIGPEEAVKRMMNVKGVKDLIGEADLRHQCELALLFLKRINLCFEVTRNEELGLGVRAGALLFPSLRVSCDVICFPRLRKHFAVARAAWFCHLCKATALGDRPEVCPKCGQGRGDLIDTATCPHMIEWLRDPAGELIHDDLPSVPMEIISRRIVLNKSSILVCSTPDGQIEINSKLIDLGCIGIQTVFNLTAKMKGVRLRSSTGDLMVSKFVSALASMKQYIDGKFRVFANSAILHDQMNRILVAIRPKNTASRKKMRASRPPPEVAAPSAAMQTEDETEELEIVVVAQGDSAIDWRKSPVLQPLLRHCELIDPLCPECLRDDIFNIVEEIPLVDSSLGPGATAMRCAAGHQNSKSDVEHGLPFDSKKPRKHPWSPLHSEFLPELPVPIEEDMGPEQRTAGKSRFLWKPVEGNRNVVTTKLTPDEDDPVRAEEFQRAKAAFYSFVGAEQGAELIDMASVEFIHNEKLEDAFSRQYDNFLEGSLTKVSLAREAIRDSSRSTPEERAAREAGEHERRNAVLSKLERSVYRRSGNESVNLVVAWHGCAEKSIPGIALNGFLEPHEMKAAGATQPGQRETKAAGVTQLDPGYFGSGIYFTQSPSNGARYAQIRKSDCLVLSWVLMGHAFPVIENPGVLKARVEPFDSHFAVVDPLRGDPCDPADPAAVDEIVVFKKSQALPRWIFRFKRKDSAPLTPIPLADRILMWIDPNVEATAQNFASLKRLFPGLGLIPMATSDEARNWLKDRGSLVAHALTVITTRRNEAGAELWTKVVQIVRGEGEKESPRILRSKSAPDTSWRKKVSIFVISEAPLPVRAPPGVEVFQNLDRLAERIARYFH